MTEREWQREIKKARRNIRAEVATWPFLERLAYHVESYFLTSWPWAYYPR